MARRKPSEYNWSKQLFDEMLLPTSGAKRRATSPRRGKVKHIDIHHMTVKDSTTGAANAKCVEIWKTRQASAHYGIDRKHVAQFVYDNAEAWGNANGQANREGIVIEHANSTLGPKWEIHDETIASSVRLVAELHVTHKLGRPSSTGFGAGGTIRTHQSFYATSCPGPYFKKIWATYVKKVQAEYDRITKATPPKPKTKPKTQTVRWHSTAFLNIWGDDGGKGQASVKTRLPKMVADVTQNRPEVIGLCEVRKEQEPAVTKAMKAKGYKLAGYSHRLALYVHLAVEVGKTSFYQYPKQNAGAIEGMLRVRLKVNGSWANYGVTHPDYRPGFDAGRVTQAKQGVRSLMRFGITSWPIGWQSRTIILADANSEQWVTDKAIVPAGFKIAVKAVIDFIYVGKSRPVVSGGTRKTASDHPIVEATFGKTVKL